MASLANALAKTSDGTNRLISEMPYPDLLERKEEIMGRLQVISLPAAPVAAKRKSTKHNSIAATTKRRGAAASAVAAAASAATGEQDTTTTITVDPNPLVPFEAKTDTHWDFVMKEMMWLGADFQGERKRQKSLAKRLGSGIRQHYNNKESRRLRELTEAELKRRKLAAKLSRELRGWWTKVERVVSYKQKLSADEERKKAMNKQLVGLVKQTERYSESLVLQQDDNDHEDEDEESESESDTSQNGRNNKNSSSRQRRRKQSGCRLLTIEQALASERIRKSKGRVTDYSRVRLAKGDDALYGESTASDASGSDASYAPESEDTDDETTLLEAEHYEIRERRKIRRQQENGSAATSTTMTERDANNDAGDDDESFYADPEELRKLKEEVEMDIGQVIERFKSEGVIETPDLVENDAGTGMVTGSDNHQTTRTSSKRVNFASRQANDDDDTTNGATATSTTATSENGGKHNCDNDMQQHDQPDNTAVSPKGTMNGDAITTTTNKVGHKNLAADPGSDADDDGDASDVEDFVNMDVDNRSDDDNGSGSEEFEADENEMDDETTMAQEEHLPREMSAQDEINMLKVENEMSIEQLRALYADIDDSTTPPPPPVEDADEDASNVNVQNDQQQSAESETKICDDAVASEKEDEPTLKDIAGNVPEEEEEDDDEFQPLTAVPEVDDETTMDAEEKLGREMSHEEEMALLQQESEIPVEQLRAMYAAIDSGSEEDDVKSDSASDDMSTTEGEKKESVVDMLASGIETEGDAEEYQPNESEAVDDETTFEAEEKLGRDMSYNEELALLKRENEMSVEELRAMYSNVDDESVDETDSEQQNLSMLNSSIVDDGKSDDKGEASSSEQDVSGKRKREADNDGDDSKKPRRDMQEEVSDDGLDALNALEASAERARKTLATRPFLLSSWVKMREYQQTGLNWLVSLQSRRLNGILADGTYGLFVFCCTHFLFHVVLTHLFKPKKWASGRPCRLSLCSRILRLTKGYGDRISWLYPHQL
jgi:hypothetical protein